MIFMKKYGNACGANGPDANIKGHTMKERKFTKFDVLDWLGADHSKDELADIVADVLNGTYKLKQLRKDIKNYVDG